MPQLNPAGLNFGDKGVPVAPASVTPPSYVQPRPYVNLAK